MSIIFQKQGIFMMPITYMKYNYMNKKTIEQYKLTTKDWFSHKQGWTIITRTGIEKIQTAENIRVRYQVEKMEQDWCVIKAIGCRGNDPKGDYLGNTPFVETYGSAKKGGFMKEPLKAGT